MTIYAYIVIHEEITVRFALKLKRFRALHTVIADDLGTLDTGASERAIVRYDPSFLTPQKGTIGRLGVGR